MLRAAQPGVMAISKAVGEGTTIRRVGAATGRAVGTDKVAPFSLLALLLLWWLMLSPTLADGASRKTRMRQRQYHR